MSVLLWRREKKNLNAKIGNLVSECGLVLAGRNCIVFFCYYHWGYNWMRHFVLQRTAGNNCLSPPPPCNKINNRLWSLVCFSFHQIPFMCYWGLAMWVGELKSEVNQYRCGNTSQCVTSPRHRGEREKKGLLWWIHQGDLKYTVSMLVKRVSGGPNWKGRLSLTDVALVLRCRFVFSTKQWQGVSAQT